MFKNSRRWLLAFIGAVLVATLVLLALGPANTGHAEANGGKESSTTSSTGRPVGSILEPLGLSWTGLD